MMTRSSFQRGWVEKRKTKEGHVWLLRYRVRDVSRKDGWRIQTEVLRNCPNKKAALRVLQTRMREVNALNNSVKPSPSLTFREFVSKRWAEYLDIKGIKPSTRYSYDSMLRTHVLSQVGEMLLDQITPEHIAVLLGKLRDRQLSAHYRLNVYALLKTQFALAVDYGFVPVSPVRKKLHRPSYRAKEKLILTPEAIGRILNEIPLDWKVLFFCLALTGLRIGELLALQWENVDWESRSLKVIHTLWKGELVTPKTEASVRVLHLPAVLYDLLLSHYQRPMFTGPQDLVFCRADGAPLDPGFLRENVLYPAMDRAGIVRQPQTHGFHLFRHSAASIVHAETGSLKLAQTLLGHARISTTADVYVHPGSSELQRAGETLAAAIEPYCSLTAHQRDLDPSHIN